MTKILKELIGGMNFKSFLIAEATNPGMTARAYIMSLPSYQEMKTSDETRGPAIKLAGDFLKLYGDDPIDQNDADEIFDAFDDISRTHFKHGPMLGDWAGDKAYKEREADDAAEQSIMDKFADATGEDAITGKKKYVRKNYRGATHQQGKFDKAKADVIAAAQPEFVDATIKDQHDRLNSARATLANSQANRSAQPRGAKSAAAQQIFNADFGTKKPSEIIRKMMSDVGMSKAHATTYYYKMKKAAVAQ